MIQKMDERFGYPPESEVTYETLKDYLQMNKRISRTFLKSKIDILSNKD